MGSIFSKRVGKLGTRLFQNGQKMVQNGRHPTVLSNSRTKNDARRVRNVMEPLQTPKTAIKKIKIKDFGVSDLGPQGGPLFSYDRESPIGPRWARGALGSDVFISWVITLLDHLGSKAQ